MNRTGTDWSRCSSHTLMSVTQHLLFKNPHRVIKNNSIISFIINFLRPNVACSLHVRIKDNLVVWLVWRSQIVLPWLVSSKVGYVSVMRCVNVLSTLIIWLLQHEEPDLDLSILVQLQLGKNIFAVRNMHFDEYIDVFREHSYLAPFDVMVNLWF